MSKKTKTVSTNHVDTQRLATATQTKAPNVVASESFHVPVDESTINLSLKKRVIYILAAFILLTLLAGTFIFLAHN